MALLAALVSLALVSGGSDRGSTLPKPAGSWYSAVAGVRPIGDFGRRTACGEVLRPDTLGVSHPVLPCGAKIYLALGRRTVLTQVIDRGPFVPGRAFDVTAPLAAKLGLGGVERIRWAYASAG